MGGRHTQARQIFLGHCAKAVRIDQQITGLLADVGVDVVPSEIQRNMDLAGVAKIDFRGPEMTVSPQNLQPW